MGSSDAGTGTGAGTAAAGSGRRPWRRWAGRGLAVAALAGLLAWGFAPIPVEVETATVACGDLTVTVEHEGRARVRERYVVSAPLAGRLGRIGLRPGDPVSPGGAPLAWIEPADPALLDARERAMAEARVSAARAALERAVPELDAARTARMQAQWDLERARSLRVRQGISESEYEAAVTAERAASANERAAEFSRKVAEYELRQAEAALIHATSDANAPSDAAGSRAGAPAARFEIPAPVSGVVLRVFQESATVVAPGTPLVEVGDPEDLECEVDVLSADAVRVEPGQRARLDHWGGPEPLEARVRTREPAAFTKISALGVEEQRVNIILDILDPPDRRAALGDGYRVEAAIVVDERRNVLKAPSGALFRRGDAWAVFVVENGRAVERPVRPGVGDGFETEILEGLREGEVVVPHPTDRVRHGVRVRPRD